MTKATFSKCCNSIIRDKNTCSYCDKATQPIEFEETSLFERMANALRPEPVNFQTI